MLKGSVDRGRKGVYSVYSFSPLGIDIYIYESTLFHTHLILTYYGTRNINCHSSQFRFLLTMTRLERVLMYIYFALRLNGAKNVQKQYLSERKLYVLDDDDDDVLNRSIILFLSTSDDDDDDESPVSAKK